MLMILQEAAVNALQCEIKTLIYQYCALYDRIKYTRLCKKLAYYLKTVSKFGDTIQIVWKTIFRNDKVKDSASAEQGTGSLFLFRRNWH